MKREFILSCLCGAVLGTVLSFSAVGCAVTAFALDAGSMAVIFLVCAVFSMAGAVCFRFKWGGAVLLGILALIVGFLWREGDAVRQTLGVVENISRVYDRAYKWGYLKLGGSSGAAYPAAAIGVLIALTVSSTVSRGKSIWSAATVALLPLLSCLVVTDTIPALHFLFLFMLGMAVLILTSSVRRKSPEQGNLLTALVTAPAALALAILFLLNPQESYVNKSFDLQQNILQWMEQIPQRLSEIPELLEEMTDGGTVEIPEDHTSSVDLRDVGPKAQQTYEVMDVFGTVRGSLYLRGQDFDFYSGTGWRSTSRQTEPFAGEDAPIRSSGAVTIETRRMRDILYLPYYPVEPMDLVSGRAYNTEGVKRYAVTVGTLPNGWQSQSVDALGAVLTVAQSHADIQAKELYLGLPEETREQAQEYLGRILIGTRSRTEKANAIAVYVRNSARYDLNTAKMPSGNSDFALWFLEDGDTGYCVHFATAAAVLLRAAGIPARYVTGYLTEAAPGETVTVTAANAHAWVEYYEPILDAWIILEATPSAGTTPETQPALQPDPDGTESVLETTGPAETEQATETTETPTAPADEDTPREPPRVLTIPGWMQALVGWILVVCGLVLTVVGQRMLRLELKRRRLSEGEPNVLALKRWREAVLLSRLLDRDRPPRSLEKLAQKAKFSQHTLTEDELSQFGTYLQDSRAELQARPWYWQLLCRYLYVVY